MFPRRVAWAAIGTVALLAAGTPAANAADGQAPEVRWAHSVTGDLGTLAVSVRSDSAVKGIKAHIVSSVTDQEVAVVEEHAFALVSGTPEDGVWHTKKPLQLADLGRYTVRIEATDTDGDRTTDDSAGILAYYVSPQFEDVHTDRSEVDTDHRQVRVDGTLMGRWPGTREVKPLADHPVDFDVDYWTENTVDTDAAGHFSGTVTVNDAVPVQAVYRHSNEYPYALYAESAPLQIGVEQVATRWVVQSPAAARTIDYGQQVTFTATLQRETPEGWVPFEGQSGGVLFEPSSSGQSASVGYFTTGADGTVTYSHAPYETGSFHVASHSDDPFIAAASTNSAEITVLRASVFTAFSAGRAQDGSVHVSGAMAFPDGWTPATIPVHVQYSPDGAQWADLLTTEATWSGSGYAFSADIPDAQAGFFRAHFEETESFQAATSRAVQAQ